MKKVIASTGLAALGVASLQAAYAPGLTAVQSSKPWSVSAAVRGFYDDNYNTRPGNPSDGLAPKQSSWGADLNPTASLNLPLDQTYIGASISYDLLYYADRTPDADHQIQAQVKLSHQFSPHYKFDANDSFVYSQEPQLLIGPGGIAANFARSELDNFMNAGTAKFNGDLTEQLSTEISYSNTLYSYRNRGVNSYSALLDRMEHLAGASLRWTALPTTVGILGYQYGYVDQTSHDPLLAPDGATKFSANVRNTRSHYAFVGVDQTFTTQLSGSVRVGVQYTEYPNAPAGAEQNTTSPYADASLTYTYNPGSYVQVGAKHQRYATYLGFLGSNTPLLDSEATSVYAMVNHKITSKLTANVLANYQNSVYHVPGVSDKADNYFTASALLSYQINQFLSAETSYNFYRLDSDIANVSFTRNLIFLGVRASY